MSSTTALATTPDGCLLVMGYQDGSLCVDECATRRVLWRATGAKEPVRALAICYVDGDDELMIVTAHENWIVQCWRAAHESIRLEWAGSGVRKKRWVGHRCSATSVCISHDNQLVAIAGSNLYHDPDYEDRDICLFSTRDGSTGPVMVLSQCGNAPCGLCFSADDQLLFSCSRNVGMLYVWSVASGKLLQCLDAFSPVRCMALRGASGLVTGHDDGSLWLWPLRDQAMGVRPSETILQCPATMNTPIKALWCTEGGRYVITREDVTVRLWDLTVGSPVERWDNDGTHACGVGVTCTGSIVTGGPNTYINAWDTVDWRRAIAPTRALLEKEWVALKRVRDACVSSSPLTTVVVGILLDAAARRLWIHTNGSC